MTSLAARTRVSPALHLYDELIGSAHGQTDHTILAYGPDQHLLGYLHYSLHEEHPFINFIFVLPPHRRQGVGTALVLHLQSAYPSASIQWGWMTSAGQALHNHLQPWLIQ